MEPIVHRALVGHELDTVAAPIDMTCDAGQTKNADTVRTMNPDGTDPAAIVVSRRTLAWAGAAILALVSGGQLASVRFATGDASASAPEPDPFVITLSARMDAVSAKVDQLTADGLKRDEHFNRVLSAVLLYQLESDRWYRETKNPNSPPRSQELEQAAQRLRDLATP